MRLKIISVLAVALLLTACADDAKNTGAATGAGSGNSGLSSNGGAGSQRPGSQEDLAANVGDRVFFSTDRSDLTPEARSTLDRQAAWLKQFAQVTVSVEGHADERGTREYNLALGNRRAIAVKNYLIALGVSPSRVATISYGKERPAILGSDEGSWAQNRRGVTSVN